jgi:hypothetical protein
LCYRRMLVLFFETGWPHGRGLVFREARILILPCQAASTLSTEHPLVIHATAKKNSVAWKWPVNAVKELLELQNETGACTSAHSAAVPDTKAEIKYARWLTMMQSTASCHAACPVATEVDMPLPGYGMTFVPVWPTIIIVGLV